MSEIETLKQRIKDLEAERGVLLNGADMVARYAFPYFKKWDKKHPSHDTAELLSACEWAMEHQTSETSQLSVEWMTEMIQKQRVAEDLLDRSMGYIQHINEKENSSCFYLYGCTCGAESLVTEIVTVLGAKLAPNRGYP